MHQRTRMFRLTLAISVLLISACSFVVVPEEPAAAEPAAAPAATRSITDVELLNVITVPYDTVAFDTPVGGLSAIAYQGEGNTYYLLSDDRTAAGPVRIYEATIDLGDGSLDEGDLTWTGLIQLTNEGDSPFAEDTGDPDGLVYTGDAFYVSSEGRAAAQPPIPPEILHFTPSGAFVESLPVPEKFLPLADGSAGARDNLTFESLALSSDGRYLISGVENALVQDGSASTLDEESPSRLLTLDLSGGSAPVEHVYVVAPIPAAPDPATGFADNGLAELIALDGDTLLALERSYVVGTGNTVRLYVVNMQDATDVSGIDALAADEGAVAETFVPVTKELLVDFGELGSSLGVAPDNLEGMALGPRLADGRWTLLVVSDNNFDETQTTQLWALALTVNEG